MAKKTKSEAQMRLSAAQARAVTLRAQGFAGDRKGKSIARVVEDHGFVRTLGGTEVYLAILARRPELTRAELEQATARGDVRVSPAVRGCIYLVAARHHRLALRIADLLSRPRAERERDKAGIKKGELEKLGDRVVGLLAKEGPLSTDAIRKRLPEGAVRSLGELGKKIGVSSTLPPALRLLEFDDRIERAQETGRLDSERYVWRTGKPTKDDVPRDPEALHGRLAELFFGWVGVGTRDDFAGWCGIGKRDAAAATTRAGAIEVEVEGIEGPCFALPSALDGIEGAIEHTEDAVALLPFEDNVLALAGGARQWVDAAHHALQVPNWGSPGTSALGEVRHMLMRAIVADGRVVGFWDYDPDASDVVTALLGKHGKATGQRVAAEAERVGAFLRDELGHGRSFSLDTDDELRKRVKFVRTLSRPRTKR